MMALADIVCNSKKNYKQYAKAKKQFYKPFQRPVQHIVDEQKRVFKEICDVQLEDEVKDFNLRKKDSSIPKEEIQKEADAINQKRGEIFEANYDKSIEDGEFTVSFSENDFEEFRNAVEAMEVEKFKEGRIVISMDAISEIFEKIETMFKEENKSLPKPDTSENSPSE